MWAIYLNCLSVRPRSTFGFNMKLNVFSVDHKIVLVVLLSHCTSFTECSPHDVEDRLCPGTTAYTRDNAYVFSSLGTKCSLENDAYVLGSIFQKYSSSGNQFDSGSLSESWENLAYLDASTYDEPSYTPAPPPVAPTCIYNERLAKQQSYSGIAYVATSCNPFALSYCRIDYDDAQSLKQNCDCNHHYAIKELDQLGNFKCFARAGVPCQFDLPSGMTDPFLMPPSEIECHSSFICKSESNTVARNEIFDMAFHGFGLNLIAYEFMKSTATGYCACASGDKRINAMNECVKAKTTTVHMEIYLHATVIISLLVGKVCMYIF